MAIALGKRPVRYIPAPDVQTKRISTIRWLLPAVGLAALIAANRSLNQQTLTALVIVALVVGIGCWGLDTWLARGITIARMAPEVPVIARDVWRYPLLGIAVVATGFTWYWSSDNTFRAEGVIAWGISVASWILAWWPRVGKEDRGKFSPSLPRSFSTKSVLVVAIVLMAVGIGAGYRLYRIDYTPLNPTSDHAEKLLDVSDVLDGKHPIFFERNTGREPTQFYFTAGLIRFFDLPTTFATLKIGTGIVGTLAIVFIYLLAAEFAGRSIGVIAALLASVSAWPTEISRAGLRFPYAMVSSAVVLWLLLRWMRTHDRRDALLCGLCVGIGLYGYSPFRIVVPAVCLGMGLALLTAKGRVARLRVIADGLLVGMTAVVVFVPLGRYSLENPDMFWFRATDQMTLGETSVSNKFLNQLPLFLENNWHALQGFNWRGDRTFVNAVTYAPMLDLLTGAFLLAGAAALIVHLFVRRDIRALFLLLSIPILMLSSTLALALPADNPSVNREGTVIPVIFLLAAIPLAVVIRRSCERFGSRVGMIVGVPVIAGLIAVAAVQNFDQYFHDFDRQTRTGVANTPEIADAVRSVSAVGVARNDVYVIDYPYWMDIRNVGFELEDVQWSFTHNVVVGDKLPEQQQDRPIVLIVNANDSERMDEIRRTYPTASVSEYPTEYPSRAFMVVLIPAANPDNP